MFHRMLTGLAAIVVVTVAPFGCETSPDGVSENPGQVVIPPEDVRVRNRNVLIFIADDFGHERYRRLSDDHVLPGIDALAAAGISFRNAWSNPTCSPTRAGILTGRHAWKHGVTKALGKRDVGLDPDLRTLPEAIGFGANSGLFGKWHLGGGPKSPTDDHGFDYFAGSLHGGLESYDVWDKFTHTKGEAVAKNPSDQEYVTVDAVTEALDWIELQIKRNSNWLAVVSFTAPHATDEGTSASGISWEWMEEDLSDDCNTDPPPGTWNEMYDLQMRCLDNELSRLLSTLKAKHEDELKETTIIFIGDNGTPGDVAELPIDADMAKGTLYQGGVHVPFIVADGYRWVTGHRQDAEDAVTGSVTTSRRNSDALVHTIDIFATVVDIFGGAHASEDDSVTLIPFLEGTTHLDERDYLYTQGTMRGDDAYAIRGKRYKLIRFGSHEDEWDEVDLEMYQLHEDPFERLDIYTSMEMTAVVSALKNEMEVVWE